MEVNVASIDGVDYIEREIIKVSDKEYALLVNENNEYDFCIKRKEKEEYFPLKDKEEFELVLMYFVKKDLNK